MIMAGTVMLFAVSLLFLPGCRNVATPEIPVAQARTGTLALTLSEQDIARAILPPDISLGSFGRFNLAFTPVGTPPVPNTGFNVPWTSATGNPAIVLEVGTWNLVVTAYPTPAATVPAAMGTATGIVITQDLAATRTVDLRPIVDGTGTFSWAISFINDVNVRSATMFITPVTGNTSASTIQLVVDGVIQVGATSNLNLGAGLYQVHIEMEHFEGEQVTIAPQYLRIYQNLASSFVYAISERHFPVTVQNWILRSWGYTQAGQWGFAARNVTYEHFNFVGIDGVTATNFNYLVPAFNRLAGTFRRPGRDAAGQNLDADIALRELRDMVDAALIEIETVNGFLPYPQHPHHETRTDLENTVTSFIENASAIGFNWSLGTDTATPPHNLYTITVSVGAIYQTVIFIRPIMPSVSITATPPVSGYNRVGHILGAIMGDLPGAGQERFQWIRVNYDTGDEVPISDATGITYTLTEADVGYLIILRVRRNGYLGSEFSTNTIGRVRYRTGSEAITLRMVYFNGIVDNIGPAGISFSVLDLVDPAPVITLSAVEDTLSSITWYINTYGSGVPRIIGSTSSLTLSPAVHGHLIGIHTITVRATIDGVHYSRLIHFEVTP